MFGQVCNLNDHQPRIDKHSNSSEPPKRSRFRHTVQQEANWEGTNPKIKLPSRIQSPAGLARVVGFPPAELLQEARLHRDRTSGGQSTKYGDSQRGTG